MLRLTPGWWRVLPLILFLTIAAALYMGLWRDPHVLPSALIGRVAPPLLGQSLSGSDRYAHRGKVWLLNVWATWCEACRSEHPVLMALAQQGVPIVGLAYKDNPGAVKDYLQKRGDPFQQILVDDDGRAGEQWGVYGAPETFVIDQQGVVRYKHVGGLTGYDWQQVILPLIQRLQT